MATAKQTATVQFRAETEDFTRGIKEMDNALKVNKAELAKVDEALKDDSGNVELLARRHELLQQRAEASAQKTAMLNSKLEAASRIYGENSTQATQWATAVARAETQEIKLAREVRNAGAALDSARGDARQFESSLDGIEDSSRGATTALQAMASSGIASEIQSWASAMGDLVETTREYREDIAKLETAFDTAGYSADAATETYRAIFAFTGEEDRSVEAAQRLAQMCESSEQLNEWTNILTGAWGVYGDALPIEGLAEAANETAQVGTVTGVLADALNWAGLSEDEFNAQLAECGSTSERVQLITDTLSATYSTAADNYRENASGIMEARSASADLADAQADLATKMEPVYTKVTEITAAFFGFISAIPTPVLTALVSVLAIAAAAMTALSIAAGIYTAAQTLMNVAMLGCPITWIILAIAALVAAIVLIATHTEELGGLWDTVWSGIESVAGAAIEFVQGLFEDPFGTLRNAVTGIVEWVTEHFKLPEIKFPEIKLPHFTISGEFSLSPLSVPSIGIEWYGKGGIFTGPTVAGIGEAGPEAVLPLDRIQSFFDAAMARTGASGSTTNIYIDGARINDDSAMESACYAFLTELQRHATMQGV